MNKKSEIIIAILLIILLIPFNVSAKNYQVIITFFSEGGEVNTGNVEVINNVVFNKDSYIADVKYKPTDTIKHLNSIDKKTTFTLKSNGKVQAKNQEWYGGKQTDYSRVYFSNSQKYKVKDIIKKLEMDTSVSSSTGEPLEIFLYANYSNVDVKNIAVKSVKLNVSSKDIKVGQTYTLTETVSPSDATNKAVTWKSENSSIATVNSDGVIKGIKAGKTNIVVTTKDGNKVAKCSVKVTAGSNKTTNNSHYVTIEYNANNGQLGPLHNKEITIKNNMIYKNNSFEFHKHLYNEKMATSGLADYNNKDFIYLTRKGYIINKGKEWNTKPDGTGKSYDQYKQYNANDFCNAKDKDCKIVLYANWKKAKTKRINLATFNIGFFNCGGSDFDCSPTVNDFSNLISNNNIDIIGLQEARLKNYFKSSSNKKKSNEAIKSIGSKAGLNNNYIIAPKNVDAILSKYKLKHKKTIPLASCEINGEAVEKRAIQKTIININGVDISYYNTHLDYHSTCAEKHMENLANEVKNDKNPIIITADYNRVQIDNYEKYLKPLGFEIAAHDTNYKGNGQNSYMDSVFVLSKNHIDIISSKTILTYKQISDHNLVIATLDIK